MQAIGQQSQALTQLAARSARADDPPEALASGGDSGGGELFRIGRGPAALDALQRKMSSDPD